MVIIIKKKTLKDFSLDFFNVTFHYVNGFLIGFTKIQDIFLKYLFLSDFIKINNNYLFYNCFVLNHEQF